MKLKTVQDRLFSHGTEGLTRLSRFSFFKVPTQLHISKVTTHGYSWSLNSCRSADEMRNKPLFKQATNSHCEGYWLAG